MSSTTQSVPSRESESTEEQFEQTRLVLRPLASPLPLGLYSFAIGSLVVAVGQLGAFGPADTQTVNFLLATFVALPELVAAVIAYLSREAVVATLLGLVSLTWPTTLVVSLTTTEMTSPPLGVLYLGVGGVLLMMGGPALQAKPLVGCLILVASVRYVTSGLWEVTGVTGWQIASGIAGLGIAGFAGYLGFALALEDTRHRTVLPTGRRGEAAMAFNGDLRSQIASLPNEAGVRNQL